MWIVTIQLGVTTVVEDRKISSANRGFSLPFFYAAIYEQHAFIYLDRDRIK